MALHSDPRRVAARLTVAYGLAGLTLAVILLAVMGGLSLLWRLPGPCVGVAVVLPIAWSLGAALAPLYSRAGRAQAVWAGMLSALGTLIAGAVCGSIPGLLMSLDDLARSGPSQWLLDYFVGPVGAVTLFGGLPALALGGLCGLHARRKLRAA